jgi:hypothetical protein
VWSSLTFLNACLAYSKASEYGGSAFLGNVRKFLQDFTTSTERVGAAVTPRGPYLEGVRFYSRPGHQLPIQVNDGMVLLPVGTQMSVVTSLLR